MVVLPRLRMSRTFASPRGNWDVPMTRSRPSPGMPDKGREVSQQSDATTLPYPSANPTGTSAITSPKPSDPPQSTMAGMPKPTAKGAGPPAVASDARSRVHDRRLRATRKRQRTKRGGGFTGAVRRASKAASSLTRLWTDEPTPAFCRVVELGAGSECATESRRTTADVAVVDTGPVAMITAEADLKVRLYDLDRRDGYTW